MTRIVLYSREGCCLCDEAREVLARVRAAHPFELDECDIDSDETLLRSYLERIPVVTIDGMEAFELFVEETELLRLLAHEPAGARRAGAVTDPRGPLVQ
jgi:hypothetical protein